VTAMRMNTSTTLVSLLGFVSFFSLAGCQKDGVTEKFIDDIPVVAKTSIPPASAVQEYLLTKRDICNVVVPVLSKLAQTTRSFPELTGPDGQLRYTFLLSEKHFGSATVAIQFQDALGGVIDPISTWTSTSTLSQVVIGVSGTSPDYSYSENLLMTLQVAGDVFSIKRLTGTSTFTDRASTAYNLTFTLVSPGPEAIYGGIKGGLITGSGTSGTGAPIGCSIEVDSNHDGNGPLTWDNQDGSVHFSTAGSGFIITNLSRILFP